ncbi:MAG: TonB-dependent receptor [Methylococcales bacterium]
MNILQTSLIMLLLLVSGFQIVHSSQEASDNQLDDFFELSPEELANIPIAIASGSAQPASRAAAVATVFTADKIKSMGATQLHQILETIPGLHVSIDPLTYDHIYSMRGIRNSNGSQVLLLINGTRLSTPFFGSRVTGFQMPIEHIQRIEVIRGPGSAVYGADAFAGVINIITKRADDIDGTNIGGRIGNWDSQSGWAQHGKQWAGWDVAASFQYQHTNGDNDRTVIADTQTGIDQVFGTQASLAPGSYNSRFRSWTAQLGFQRKYVDINVYAWKQNDAGTGAGVASTLDPNGSTNSENYLADLRFSSEDQFDNFQLNAHLSYLYSNFHSFLNIFPSNTRLPIGNDGNISFTNPVGLVDFPNGYIGAPDRKEQIPSIELTGIYDGFNNHKLRISSGYRYETIKTNSNQNFGPGVIDGTQSIVTGDLTNVADTPFVYLKNTDRSIWSLSLQHEWSFADDWLLTWGGRYDYYSDFGHTVNPRLGLSWVINDKLTTKLLYGRAFRAPSFAEQGNINNPVLLGNPDLDPETINTIELAFNYVPLSNLRTGLNVYWYHISDLIQPVPDTGGTTVTVQNASNQQGYGLELEWDWKIIDQLGISGNYAWQHSKNEQTNKRVAGVPQHQIYFALNWNFLPHWLLQNQVNWVGGRSRAAGDNRSDLDDYALVDLTLQRKNLFKHLNISASVRNVFDNRDARELGGAGLIDDIPLNGRSYYLEMSVHF